MPDRCDSEAAEPAEDLTNEDQQGKVGGGGSADQPATVKQCDGDGGNDDVGRPYVDDVPGTRRQRATRNPVGDDALAHQRSDHLARGAGHGGAPVAKHVISAEHGQRDHGRPHGQ